MWSSGADRCQPSAMARAACSAVRVPVKQSGAMRTRTRPVLHCGAIGEGEPLCVRQPGWYAVHSPDATRGEGRRRGIRDCVKIGRDRHGQPPQAPLLVLGQGTDLHTERGVECPGDLPGLRPGTGRARAGGRAALGDRVFVLGHHYQRDEVIEFADTTGDSFKLAKAAARPDAPWIVFCGVHFMAESADILTSDDQTVILPDLAAGCSMADMAAIDQVEDCWDDLVEAGIADRVVPVTYMNSSAAIKAFTGRHGGTICTSSNARTALTWALDKAGDGGKVLFLPDQHLGRNTYARDLGRPLEDCVVWDPHKPMGGLTPEQLDAATMILWRGHCSVHGRFSVEAVEAPAGISRRQVIVHPECRHEVVEARRRGRIHREDHQDHRRRTCRHQMGGRHRTSTSCADSASSSPSSRSASWKMSATARR